MLSVSVRIVWPEAPSACDLAALQATPAFAFTPRPEAYPGRRAGVQARMGMSVVTWA